MQAVSHTTFEVGPALYAGIAVVLALTGVFLARLVTINEEEKLSGVRPKFRETGPLTWIGLLIVGPLIWHYEVPVPWAGMIGLGVGYSVKVILKTFGGAAVNAARGITRRAADALDEAQEPIAKKLDAPGARPAAVIMPPTTRLTLDQSTIDGLEQIPSSLPPTAEKG